MSSSIPQPNIKPIQGNPRTYAIDIAAQSAQKQNALNNTLSGGAVNTGTVVPTIRTPYPSFSGPGQDSKSTQINNAVVSQQSSANRVYDQYATVMGGRRRRTRRRKTRRRKTRRRRSTLKKRGAKK
jgi:hypothetical protein